MNNYGKAPPSKDPEDDWQPYKRTTPRRFIVKRADWKRRSAASLARRSAHIEKTRELIELEPQRTDVWLPAIDATSMYVDGYKGLVTRKVPAILRRNTCETPRIPGIGDQPTPWSRRIRLVAL